MRYYTGIGSRVTPDTILEQMTIKARELAGQGFTLRSGGAIGADSAFEAGAGWSKEIYIPWDGFSDRWLRSDDTLRLPKKEAFAIAAKYHPNWPDCTPGVRILHARNVHQVLGEDLATPSEFVICWTPGGKVKGGTGEALRIAKGYGIKIINLGE